MALTHLIVLHPDLKLQKNKQEAQQIIEVIALYSKIIKHSILLTSTKHHHTANDYYSDDVINCLQLTEHHNFY